MNSNNKTTLMSKPTGVNANKPCPDASLSTNSELTHQLPDTENSLSSLSWYTWLLELPPPSLFDLVEGGLAGINIPHKIRVKYEKINYSKTSC
jgi:hypothetical protein